MIAARFRWRNRTISEREVPVKKAVSVSLGSPTRDKQVVVTLGDQSISVRRIGTDGDVEPS